MTNDEPANLPLGAPLPVARARAVAVMALLWFLAVALGAFFDARVSTWVRDSGLAHQVKGAWWANTIKRPGEFLFTLVIAAVLCFLHPLKWQAGFFALASNVMGLMNSLIKWVVGRTRPFELPPQSDVLRPFDLLPFRGGVSGIFQQRNLSFPSGHASVAFATATALAILLPRYRWAWYAVAVLVAIERVSENAHYLSDVVGAAGMSVCGVHLLWILLHKRVKYPPDSTEVLSTPQVPRTSL